MTATLNRQEPVTEVLPEPLTDIQQLRVEILTIGEGSSGSLRLEILGCSECEFAAIFNLCCLEW